MPQNMRVNIRPKAVSFSFKTLTAAVVSTVLFSSAHAVGLGKLTVLSSLGQPLHAEIELTSVSKDEAGALTVKLAPTDAFRQANIEFNPALFTLRFAIEQRSGRQFIRVTSTQPINEPFVDMLLEMGGTNSRLVREYTFLLDPADLRKTQPAQIAAPNTPASSAASQPIAQPEPVPQPVLAEKPVSAAKPPQQAPVKRASAAQAEANNASQSEGYEVKKGDTLARIASQVKPEGVSLDQMLIALQRANPSAFIGNNINRLRAGQILSVPDAETARGISNSEAKNIVVAQAADFNSYRNKLAGQVAGSTSRKSDEIKQSATGKITAKVEEQPTAASEAKDKLKLSKSGTAAAGSDKATSIAAGAEDKIAKDKALAEANARVKELEKNVNDLQKILEIKNKDLADKQKQANAGKSDTLPALPAPSPAAVPNSTSSPAAVPAIATPPAAASATTSGTPQAAASAPAPSQATDAKPAAPKVNKPAPAKRKPVAPVPPPESSFIDDLLDNPLLLSLLAIAGAGLGAFGIYSIRRRKQRREFEESNILTDSGLKANSLFGSTGGQSVDTNNSVFNSNFAPSASQLDTNEVDPVAEADVYIAYGRDAQAEEILKEALRTQPDRSAVRVKLLEIYANRKDVRAFEILATELYSMTRGEGDDWRQATGLGIAIDPNNPLYAGGKPPAAGAAKTAALIAPTQPLDELDLEALLNTTQGANASPENLNTLESSGASFNNTDHAATVPVLPEPEAAPAKKEQKQAPALSPVPAPSATPAAEASNGLDFDFDLESLGIKEVALPPTMQNEPLPELEPASNALNLDFHQSVKQPVDTHKKDVTAAKVAAADVTVTDFAPLEIDIPKLPETAAAGHQSASALDFDLSGISLDLSPADMKPAAAQDAHAVGGDQHSNVAEMATKLDLALAYQEIGDKEGARELLDEVVKGGSAEQSEKAKAMLQKLA
ncbi:MAG: LysM peptidoglycan-binding protein [Herminiimonas sp.]|nr:LysM peptidoglycan-binding protein [Herminiimonas sp.]